MPPDPYSIPALLGSYVTPGNANGVAVSGRVAYVADLHGSLQLIDVSNPALSTLIEFFDRTG